MNSDIHTALALCKLKTAKSILMVVCIFTINPGEKNNRIHRRHCAPENSDNVSQAELHVLSIQAG